VDQWGDHLRAALEHLHQSSFLAASPLCSWLPDAAAAPDIRVRSQQLRRALLDAIELLRPGRPLPFGSREARSYEVLTLRYVEGMASVEIAEELGVSERQVYRDLRQALDQLLQLLRPTPPATRAGDDDRQDGDVLQDEMQRLVIQPRGVDVAQTIAATVVSLEPLAGRHGVGIEYSAPADLPLASADEGLLKQTLAQALSLAIQSVSGGDPQIRVHEEDNSVVITLSFPTSGEALNEALLGPLRVLAEVQHLGLTSKSEPGSASISLAVGIARPQAVLVVEDNEGAIELYRRYLAQADGWLVSGATDPRVAVDMARRTKPAAILLDIMMPRQDGWSLLQTLRAHPETENIPVVVCSVFADPELAAALGADAYLTKPVSRVQLLTALRSAVEARHQGG